MAKNKKLILAILDGFGLSPQIRGNALFAAETPNLSDIVANYPSVGVLSFGTEVGLRWGEMGNSEVGHINIGAGRVVIQDSTKIFEAIENRKLFYENEVLIGACDEVDSNDSTLHIINLLSSGGVHGHMDHLLAFLELAKKKNVKKIALHLIADGRDSEPKSFLKFYNRVKSAIAGAGAKVASLSGRYYAMDRDRKWDRTKAAFLAMAEGQGRKADNLEEIVNKAYENNETDEFIIPTVFEADNHDLRIKDKDVVVFTNFRADRARQLTRAFADPDFDDFERNAKKVLFITFTDYGIKLVNSRPAFVRDEVKNQLAKVFAESGLRQLRVSETEKYAHVTYFFNGGLEKPFDGEKRILIKSPTVATYDMDPGMSTKKVTDTLLDAYDANSFDVAVVNFANPDMVGHTGKIDATAKAIETVDKELGRIAKAVITRGDILMITGDHGNAEQLIHPDTGEIDKEHTANPVPVILVHPEYKRKYVGSDAKRDLLSIRPIGILADIAPTVIDIMGLKQPREMTGRSLLRELKRA